MKAYLLQNAEEILRSASKPAVKGGEGALAREKKILASQVSKTRLGTPAEDVNRASIRPYDPLSVRFGPLEEFVSGLSARGRMFRRDVEEKMVLGIRPIEQKAFDGWGTHF
jgi:hypothetical protein